MAAVLPLDKLAELLWVAGNTLCLWRAPGVSPRGRTVLLPDGRQEKEFAFEHRGWWQLLAVNIRERQAVSPLPVRLRPAGRDRFPIRPRSGKAQRFATDLSAGGLRAQNGPCRRGLGRRFKSEWECAAGNVLIARVFAGTRRFLHEGERFPGPAGARRDKGGSADV